MFKQTPVFHVGFPKTGTTTLQNCVFSQLSGATFLGRYSPDDSIETREQAIARGVQYLSGNSVRRFYRGLLHVDSLHFDLESSRRTLCEITQNVGDTLPVFSHEDALNTRRAYPDAQVKADRIAQIFGSDIRILITVREQKSLLKSLYRFGPYDPMNPWSGRYIDIDAWLESEQQKVYCSLFDLLHFDRTMGMYQSAFGADNVLVLPMEMMARDPGQYARRLGEFVGADAHEIVNLLENKRANVGVSANLNRYRRFRRNLPVKVRLSSLVPVSLRDWLLTALAKGSPQRVDLGPKRVREYDALFGPSNRRLSEMTGIDFAGFGYAVNPAGTQKENA